MAHERILIVEDENITAMDIGTTLQQFGYEPLGPVASGEDAVTSAVTLRPDIILMDILLKEPMDGIQAAQAIRSHYRCPVIYVTGQSGQPIVEQAGIPKASGYIMKPIIEEELHTAIEGALRQPGVGEFSSGWPPMVRSS